MQSTQGAEESTSSPTTQGPSSSARPSSPKAKVFSRYPLPSERTPFTTHFDILNRFVAHSRNGQEPIKAEKVEGEGIPVQAAQMNVRFLEAVGLLRFDSKGLYLPASETVKFVNAKTVSDERARPILRAIIRSAWFSEIATNVLRTRPGLTDDELVGELALAAQTNKEKKGPALRVLVEYLVWSGIVARDNGALFLAEAAPALSSAAGGASAPTPGVETLTTPSTENRRAGPGNISRESGAWHIVQTEDYFLKVRSDSEVVEELRDQLSLLTKKIERLRSRPTAPDEERSGTMPKDGSG